MFALGTTHSVTPPGDPGDLLVDLAGEPGERPDGHPLLRLAKVLLGVLVGLFVFDRVLGAVDSSRDLSKGDKLMRDNELAWTNRPGYSDGRVYINALGLRGPEIPPDAPPNELRILGTGPSTTFGAGDGGPNTDQTWSAVLERALAAESGGQPVRVLNGGVMGYSAIQAARRALKLLPVLHPDLVLVFVGPGAQALLDPSNTRHYASIGGDLVPLDIVKSTPEPLLPAAIFAHKALSHSAIYTRWRNLQTDEGRRPAEIQRFILSRKPRPALDEMLERTWADMASLGQRCREEGVELRILLVPEPEMYSDQDWQRTLTIDAVKGAPPVGTPRREPIDVLGEKLESLGLTCWSLYDAVSLIGSDKARYTGDQRHWSPAGHDVVAAAIQREMRREGLLESLAARRAAHPRTP